MLAQDAGSSVVSYLPYMPSGGLGDEGVSLATLL